MKIKLINSYNETINIFEYTHSIKISDIELNKNFNESIESEFVQVSGIFNVKGNRKINITLNFSKKTESEFLNFVNQVYSFFLEKKAPFYYIDLDNNRMCEISLIKMNKLLREGTEFIFSQLELELKMLDSLFFSNSETENIFNFNNVLNGQFSINSSNENLIFPKIEIQILNKINNFVLFTNKGFFININTQLQIPTDYIILDSLKNEIYILRNNNKISLENEILSGGFILIDSGINIFNFQSDIASDFIFKINYRERFIL